MTDTAPGAAAEPDGAPRLPSLDVLRGIAILGILFMNINDMGASMTASFGDVRHIGWSAADQVAWWLRQVFANGTARCLLEMLFGAGMVILTGRLAEGGEGWSAMKRYYWRNVVLFGFGLVHIVILLWPGDILHSYAIAALLIFPLRHLPARQLIAIGLSAAALQVAGGAIGYVEASRSLAAHDRAVADRAAHRALTGEGRDALKARAEWVESKAKEARAVAAEDRARSGTAASWIAQQWGESAERREVEPFVVFEAVATMLLGAGLFKIGWLQGERSASWYGRALIAAYAVALVLRMVEAREAMDFAPGVPRIGWATMEVGRLAMTLGHVFLVHWLLLRRGVGARVLAPFRAAGQTALTIYILQSIVALWVLFPPWGLALYGRFGWAALMGIAFVIDAVLLVAAIVWVRHFRIAPVEWAWRSIVAGRRLAFRRGPSGAARAPTD